MKTIAVLGTFDTKGIEHGFVADQIRLRGHNPLLIDVGGIGESQIVADVTCDQVADLTGINIVALRAQSDRGSLVAAMARSVGPAAQPSEFLRCEHCRGAFQK